MIKIEVKVVFEDCICFILVLMISGFKVLSSYVLLIKFCQSLN